MNFINVLTSKQLDVLACLLFGLSYKSIGKVLCISSRTVEGHVRELLQKTNFFNKDEIITKIRLPSNEILYKTLEKRFNTVIDNQSSISSNDLVSIFRYKNVFILGFCIVLIFFFSIYYFQSNQTLSLNNIGMNSYLLKRDALISKIKKTFSNSCNVIAIVGQGGAGKTTIAREYLRANKSAISYELNAETFDTLKDNIIGLAYALADTKKSKEDLTFINSISNEAEKMKQISIFLYSRLKNLNSWCLVLDNVDDCRILNAIYPRNLEKLKNGKILITTRNYNIGDYILNANILEIGELSTNEKEQLFKKITCKEITQETKKYLLELPNYPLDISSSAYYVKNVNISLKEYVERMRRMSDNFWNNNKKVIQDSTNYKMTRDCIISSTLTHIINTNKKYQEILFAISLLDSQNIPISILNSIVKSENLDDLICYLKKYGLITVFNDSISIHRSTQMFTLFYLLKTMDESEQCCLVKKLTSIFSPYGMNEIYDKNSEQLIPHLQSLTRHLEKFDYLIEERIRLLISLGLLSKSKLISTFDSLMYFGLALTLNKQIGLLSPYETALIFLEAGESCVLSNRNNDAMNYLNQSFVSLKFTPKYATSFAKNYNLLGLVEMRNNHFTEANAYFYKSLSILNNLHQDFSFSTKLIKANSYVNLGLNYSLYYINKPEIKKSIEMFEQSVQLLQDTQEQEGLKVLANTKVKLSGICNSLKEYKKAITYTNEAEKILQTVVFKDNGYYSILCGLLMERGHAFLRLNELDLSKDIFSQARELFDKTMIGDYRIRVRMQEAETLVRLGFLEDAYKNCLEVFEMHTRARNDFNDLFFNTAYYNAGVVQYKMGNLEQSLKYFQDFASNMSGFCKSYLSHDKYKKLLSINAFEIIQDTTRLKECFENALNIYISVCVDGSEFITDYVEQNYKNCY